MGKRLSLMLLMLVFAASCFAQYQIPSYLKTEDFSTIKRYLKDSIDNLDPIEGVYNVQVDRKCQYITTNFYGTKFQHDCGLGDFVFQCAIYKESENTFQLVLEDSLKMMEIPFENMEITRLGEVSIYSVRTKYTSTFCENCLKGDIDNRIKCKQSQANSRIVMESQLGFVFSLEIRNSCRVYSDYGDYYPKLELSDEYSFVKEYPTSSMYGTGVGNGRVLQAESWTGTGYAIGNGYIVTNNHVADGARTILIKGIRGDMNTGYNAEVVTSDKSNDLAILKVTDANFKGFGIIPYSVSSRMANVGEDVFVLGYPLTQVLGNEIKLTNGIVSSRTGYQGDISTYQISAPVQPGNSGGPMFDSKGNIIGIVVAGVPGAENVGYAIKTSYLKILIESADLKVKFPTNNAVSTLSLAEKVRKVKPFVYLIECSSR